MDELLRFGFGTYSYIFDRDNQVSIQGDFGDAQPKSADVLGMSGGAYLYGFDRQPNGPGNVQGYFWMFADSPNEMAEKRDAVKQMLDWGQKHIVKRLQSGVQVWTWGAVTNIQMAQSVKNVPHRMQLVQVNFHCPTARWFGHDGEALYGEAESLFLDGLPVFVPKIDRADVGNTDTVEITNSGNATAGCYIRWEAPAGVIITNPKLTRLNEYGELADSIEYTDTIAAESVVDIDGRNHLLFENDVVSPEGGYDKLTVLHGGWLEIPPGTHTLTVAGTFAGGDGKLTVDCWDTYR
jgi:hypothetical protein